MVVKMGYTYRGQPIGGGLQRPGRGPSWNLFKILLFLVIILVLGAGVWGIWELISYIISRPAAPKKPATTTTVVSTVPENRTPAPVTPVTPAPRNVTPVTPPPARDVVPPPPSGLQSEINILFQRMSDEYRSGQFAKSHETARSLLEVRSLPENITAQTIGVLNSSALKLFTGQVPSSRLATYVIQQNDNLGKIAKNYNTSIRAIVRTNGFKNENEKLAIGQKLKIYKGDWSIRINPATKRLYLYDAGKLFKIYPITIGEMPVLDGRELTLMRKPGQTFDGGANPGSWLEIRPLRADGNANKGFDICNIDGARPGSPGSRPQGYFRMNYEELDEFFMIVPAKTPVSFVSGR